MVHVPAMLRPKPECRSGRDAGSNLKIDLAHGLAAGSGPQLLEFVKHCHCQVDDLAGMHAVGRDVETIAGELLDELERAARIVRALPRVDEVTVGSRGLTISTANGAALVAQVAVALSENGVATESLTVRTPSLDDVFLRATGHRLANEESQ